jgi:hypothetical protein
LLIFSVEKHISDDGRPETRYFELHAGPNSTQRFRFDTLHEFANPANMPQALQ